MLVSPYGHTCELATKMAVLENPQLVASLGEACMVEARKDGQLPDHSVGQIRRLGAECITHCLARRLAPS